MTLKKEVVAESNEEAGKQTQQNYKLPLDKDSGLMISLHNQRCTIKEISEKLGTTRWVVYNRLKALGYEPIVGRDQQAEARLWDNMKLFDSHLFEVKAMAGRGCKRFQVANHFGVSLDFLREKTEEHNILWRTPPVEELNEFGECLNHEFVYSEIIRRAKRNEPVTRLVKEFGLARKALKSFLEREGVLP